MIKKLLCKIKGHEWDSWKTICYRCGKEGLSQETKENIRDALKIISKEHLRSYVGGRRSGKEIIM